MPQKNPIFSLLSQKADKVDYQLLETEESKKKFFLKAISISSPPLLPPIELKEGGHCELLSQHASIYEYCSDKVDFFNTYHFTFEIRETSTHERVKVRCYFTAQGIFTRITCKQSKAFRALSEASQQRLIHHAQFHMQPIMDNFSDEIERARKKLWKQITQYDNQLQAFNREPKKHLEACISYTQELIRCLHQLSQLGDHNKGRLWLST